MAPNDIKLLSRPFIEGYVQTALYDAGTYLQAKADEEAIKASFEKKEIEGGYRPIILNYTDNSWNWGTHSLLIDLIKLVISVVQKSSSTPPSRPLTQDELKAKKEEEEKKKKESAATGAVIGGGLAVIIGGFFTGKNYEPFMRYQETAKYTQSVYEATKQMPESPLKKSFQALVQCQQNIDNLRARKIMNYFYAAVGTTLGGAALVTGGVLGIHFLIPSGKLIVIASLALAAINAGVHSSDDKTIRKNYERIGGDGKTHNGHANWILTNELRFYDEEMVCDHQPRPLYPSYYPEYNQPQYKGQAPSAPPMDA